MSSVILLEGVDGSGKTSLAEWLRARHGYQIIHTGKPHPGEDLFRSYTDTLMRALTSGVPTVFDRHFLGELVYGPVMRGKSLLSDDHLTLLMRVVRGYGVRLVVCQPRLRVAYKNWKAKKIDYLKTDEQFNAVYAGFKKFVQGLKLATYDYELSLPMCPGYPDSAERQADHGAQLMDLLHPDYPRCPDGMVGSPNARYLFVGERVNPRACSWDLAFHDANGASGYLMRALKEAGIKEEDLAFTNVQKLNGDFRDVHNIRGQLQKAEVTVTLGQIASIEVRRQRTPFRAIPHPQYWKRFHAKEFQKYVRMLKEATK